MFELTSHPEVSQELDDQLAWLSRKTLWMAARFADAYAEALRVLATQPTRGHLIWKDYRRYNIPRFPHALIYRAHENTVYLMALMHERRHPDYWKARIDS